MCITCTLHIPSDPVSEAPITRLVRAATSAVRRAKDLADSLIDGACESRIAKNVDNPPTTGQPARLRRREIKRREKIMATSEALLNTAQRVRERTNDLLGSPDAVCRQGVDEPTRYNTLPPRSYTSSKASTSSTSTASKGLKDSGVALPSFRSSPTRAASTRWPEFRDHHSNSEERIPAYTVAAQEEWLNHVQNAAINERVRRAIARCEDEATRAEIDAYIERQLDELERQREENWERGDGAKRAGYEKPRVADIVDDGFQYDYEYEHCGEVEPPEGTWRDV